MVAKAKGHGGVGRIEFNPMDRKYGNLADHREILKRLQKLIDLMEEQNDIMLFEGCCPGCDGTCGEGD